MMPHDLLSTLSTLENSPGDFIFPDEAHVVVIRRLQGQKVEAQYNNN